MANEEVICIIVTFNRVALLEKVLHNVLNQSRSVSKLIVVDNNSQDNTSQLINEYLRYNDKIVYYNTGANLGGSGGFKIGFSLAEKFAYDYIWVMDDDCMPDFDCLENLLKVKGAGIVQPTRYNPDGTCAELSPVTYNLTNPFYLNPKRKSVIDCQDNLQNDSTIELHGVPFEGPLISKKVVKDVGFPNSDFFIFYDDLDFSLRTRKLGYKIVCTNEARATRLLINNQSNDLKSWKGYFMLRNLFYIHKVYGENKFVKFKPYALTLGYILLSLLKIDFRQVGIVYSALRDSKNLANTNFFKPK